MEDGAACMDMSQIKGGRKGLAACGGSKLMGGDMISEV